MYNPNHHNTHNRNFNRHTTNAFVTKKFVPPDWDKMSTRQKMVYIKGEIEFIRTKMSLPDADIKYWRGQLSYFLWLPIKNSLHIEEAKKEDSNPQEERISKGVSKFLFGLCEGRIPLEQGGAIEALNKMHGQVSSMIAAYDLRALNTLRANIGMEAEVRDHGMELFTQIFAPEIKERQAKQPVWA